MRDFRATEWDITKELLEQTMRKENVHNILVTLKYDEPDDKRQLCSSIEEVEEIFEPQQYLSRAYPTYYDEDYAHLDLIVPSKGKF